MSKQGCKTLRKMFVFMALFPPLRALPPSVSPTRRRLYRRRASRRVLPCPTARLFPSPPFRSSSPHPPTGRRSYFLPSPCRCAPPSLIPFFPPRREILLCHPYSIAPLRLFQRDPSTGRNAGTAGRDHPHCRGHHFNVTLIKSNNQYLPRKKF